MYGYNQEMSEMHAILAWCMVLLFLVRGLAYQFGANWPKDSRLDVLVFGIVVLLAVSGLSLWALRFFNPLRDSWLMAKLLALAIYAVSAHLAMGRGRFHALFYLIALLCLAYILQTATIRSPWLGLA